MRIDNNKDGTATQIQPPLNEVFPASKIKAQLHRNEDFGRVLHETVQCVSTCSALLLQKLVQDVVAVVWTTTAENNNNDNDHKPLQLSLLDIQHYVKQHPEDLPFVSDSLFQLTESDAIKRNSKRQRRKPTAGIAADSTKMSSSDPLREAMSSDPLREAMDVVNNHETAIRHSLEQIVEDDDDYD